MSHNVQIPQGLKKMLKGLTRDILENNPADLEDFGKFPYHIFVTSML